MKPVRAAGLLITLLLVGCVVTVNDRVLVGKDRVATWQSKLVIAHRGSERLSTQYYTSRRKRWHTRRGRISSSKISCHDPGLDQVVVLHDHHLDTCDQYRDVFPDRARA